MKTSVEEYIKKKNENRPENIIKGIDPVAVGLVKQIYSALLDRGENVVLYEKIWLKEVERAYKDQETYDSYFINGLEILLKQAYNILTSDTKPWDIKEEEILAITEKILFLKVREDIYKDFFDDFEDVLFSAVQLDFSKRVNFTQIGNSKENIFSYKAVMLNTLIETMENSVVSMQSVNEIIGDIPGLVCIITDKNGIIRFINSVGEELLTSQNENLIKKNITDILPEYKKIKIELKEKGSVKDFPINVILKKDSSSKVAASITVKSAQTPSTVEEFIHLIKIHQKPQQNTDLDLKQQLHDKIAPINTLISGLDVIGHKLIDKDSKKILEDLKNTALRLKRSANEELKSIIAITNNPIEKVSLINVEKIVKEIIEDINLINADSIEFVKEIHNFKFYSKDKLVYSILQNLLSNAVKYRKQSKKTVIKVRFFEPESGKVTFQISDTGMGIKQSDIKDIFTPKFRISQETEGNGIGLSLVKNYVDKLNGEIKVESAYGKGSKFSVSLPNLK
ncbi:MAG: GHKL domain-containing protein [Bacteroidetes bacterium]|nr:GHKL domain-containing protein [Bacteroidota bacterium]